MRCKNCNAELAVNANFCIKCGTPVGDATPAQPAQQATVTSTVTDDDDFEPTVFVGNMNATQSAGTEKTSVSKTNTNHEAKNPAFRKYLPFAVIALLLILAFNLFIHRRKTIDLTKYATVEFNGSNGYGTAVLNWDSDKLTNDISKAIGYDKASTAKKEKYANLFISILDISMNSKLDKNSDLSNGDKVTLCLPYDNADLKQYRLRFKGDGKKVKVKGLDKIRKVDPFEYVEASFEGTSPNAEFHLKKKQTDENFVSALTFEASQDEGLKTGDKVTVTASCDGEKNYLQKTFGVELSKTTMDYTVGNVSNYLFNVADLEASSQFADIQNQAETVFKADFAQNTDTLTYKDLKYEGYYFLTQKDGVDAEDYNRLYMIYSATIKTKYEDNPQTCKVYLPIRFRNLIQEGDGTFTVDLNDYARTGEEEINDLGTEGYKNIANMQNDLITASGKEYEGTENIK